MLACCAFRHFSFPSRKAPSFAMGPGCLNWRSRHTLISTGCGAVPCAWSGDISKNMPLQNALPWWYLRLFLRRNFMDSSQLLFGTVMFSFPALRGFFPPTHDIVLGAAEILGLQLPENFPSAVSCRPRSRNFGAAGISVLSQWFRDYVYYSPWVGTAGETVRRDGNPDHHLPGQRFVAWCKLDLPCLGRVAWRDPGGGKSSSLAQTDRSISGTYPGNPRNFCRVCFYLHTIFRADSLTDAVTYFRYLFTTPGMDVFSKYWELGLSSRLDLLLLLAGVALLILVDVLHECGIHLRDRIAACPLPVSLVHL